MSVTDPKTDTVSDKPLVGIGACLIGQPVRYNGESKRSNQHIQYFSDVVQLQPFCPEVGIGLGVPRKTLRLVGSADQIRLVDSDTQQQDVTSPIRSYADRVFTNNPQLAGYILVKGSPSCGYERVKRYNDRGHPVASDARGIFADALHRLDPLLPLEEDGRLNDHALRENFVTRVYAYHDWKCLLDNDYTFHDLIQFWSRYKYLVMAHHIDSYREIGRLLANSSDTQLAEKARRMGYLLMSALQHMATRKTHTNVLQHIRGYLKHSLNREEKQEVDAVIEQYRNNIVPLIVPLTLLKHLFNRHHNDYIQQQVFMYPYPEQLSLRNHI